jgi:hypothetical protein
MPSLPRCQECLSRRAQQAAAVLANANLLPTSNGHEIAGVHNDGTAVVSDNEGDAEDDNDDVEYMGENLNTPNAPDAIDVNADPPQDDNDGAPDHDFGTGQDGGEESDTKEQEEAVEEQESEDDRSVCTVRRSGRRRKTTPRLVVEHKYRAYRMEDGVLHINPSILQKPQRDLKIAPNKMGPEPKPVD